MNDTSVRIRGFDGLRAIAFLLVFVSHKAFWQTTERYGTAGVWMFFVLSGFLITRILAKSRSDIEAGRATPRGALQDFYLRRTLRIFPIYYLFLSVLAILAAAGLMELDGPYRQLSDWLFLSNLYIEYSRNWGVLGHLWSLAVEEQFYLLFAPLALFLPSRCLPYVCAGLIAVSGAAHLGLLLRDASLIHFDANSLVNFGLLGLGGLAGLVADRPLPKAARSDLAIGAALVGFLVIPVVLSTSTWLHAGRLGGVLVALLLVQIYQSQGGRMVSLLNWGGLRHLGVISYCAYLIHKVFDFSAILVSRGYQGPAVHVGGALLDLAVTVVLASLSWRFFEAPIRGLAGRGRLSAQKQAS